MTTIVTDGKTVSADSRLMSGSMICQAPCVKIWKVYKARGNLVVGIAGTCAETSNLISWTKGYMDRPPELEREDGDWDMMIVKKGTVLAISSSYLELYEPGFPFGIGSGAEYAIGAIAMGADTIQAVEVAAQFDSYTGGMIKTIEL